MRVSTPTKYEVLEAWVAHTSHDLPTAYDLVEAGESFNRWLAAEKAKWQAEAWDEGWEARRNYDERAGEPPPPNPYEKGSDDDRL